MKGQISIEGLKVDCIIGIHPHERSGPQTILVDVDLVVDMSAACRDDAINATVDYEAIVNTVTKVARDGQYQLVEKLADACAAVILEHYPTDEVFVRIRKPGVVADTDTVGVSVVRRRQGLREQPLPSAEPPAAAVDVSNKVIAVTGATGEFGSAVARYLMERGAHVVLLAEGGDRLVEAAERIRRETKSDRCSHIECDVRSSESVAKAFGEVEKQHAQLDALVNLAAYPADFGRSLKGRPASELVVDAERVLGVDLLGTLRAVLAAEAIMRRQDCGVIITIGTAATLDFTPSDLVHQIASAGVRQLTQALGVQHDSRSSIRLYWLALGTVFTSATYDSFSPAQRATTSRDGWLDPAEHIAPVIAALIAGRISRKTGSTIRLDATTIGDLSAEIGR